MSSIIINNLKNIENYSYLELGIRDNKNFNQILSKDKYSVDTNGNAMFTGTTDEYFESLADDKKFDIIFIDACHDYQFVVNDFNNSIDHATKWILLHDMIPPTKKYIQSSLCSDSYKVLYYMLKEESFEMYPMDNNFGFTLIRMPAKKITPSKEYAHVTYEEFTEFMKDKKVYSDDEIIEMLRNENV